MSKTYAGLALNCLAVRALQMDCKIQFVNPSDREAVSRNIICPPEPNSNLSGCPHEPLRFLPDNGHQTLVHTKVEQPATAPQVDHKDAHESPQMSGAVEETFRKESFLVRTSIFVWFSQNSIKNLTFKFLFQNRRFSLLF